MNQTGQAMIGYTILALPFILAIACVVAVFKAKRSFAKVLSGVGFLVFAVPAGFIVFFLGSVWGGWTFHVADVDCGSNRRIEIRSPYWSELSQPLEYEVYEGRKKLLRHSSYFGSMRYETDKNSLRFRCLLSPDGSVAALTEEANPGNVLALHDFNAGWEYPGNWNLPWDEHERRAADMLSRVQMAHSNMQFRLAGQSGSIGIREERDAQPEN